MQCRLQILSEFIMIGSHRRRNHIARRFHLHKNVVNAAICDNNGA